MGFRGVSSQMTRPPRYRDPASRLGAGPEMVRSRRDLGGGGRAGESPV